MKSEQILKKVPKVSYGTYGGITPFPICLKAVSDYLGEELDYTFAIVASGGAFRLAWNREMWDGGNVDITHTYEDPELAFRYGVSALGREFKMLWKEGNGCGHPGSGDKEAFKAFIREQLDKGIPLISMGPVGPPEAAIITGYRDGGNTLLGWSLFQDWGWKDFSEEGYFVTDQWWEAEEFFGVMALGEVSAPRFGTKQIVEHAIAALEGRQEGAHAKGVAAYDAWKKALLGVTEKDLEQPDFGESVLMMCEGDATDCLTDGRKHAGHYFKQLAKENPGESLYEEIAEQFYHVATIIDRKVYSLLGGWERGEEEIQALEQEEIRREIGEYIDEMKAADEEALALMKELLHKID